MADDAPLPAAAEELVEQLIARVNALEFELAASPAALSGEVLLLPGVKRLLMRSFLPDKPGLSKAERKAFANALQKIIAAYDGLEKKGGQSWLTMH
jgi:hypothetical protein